MNYNWQLWSKYNNYKHPKKLLIFESLQVLEVFQLKKNEFDFIYSLIPEI